MQNIDYHSLVHQSKYILMTSFKI